MDQRPIVVRLGLGNRSDGATLPMRDRADFSSCLTIPICSDSLCHPPSQATRDAVDLSNASVLGFLLQEVDLDAMPRPADERLAEALAPLRIKLDMLIDMIGRLSYRDVELPPLCEVVLGPTQIDWCCSKPWQRGDQLRIQLYFNSTFREPVVLIAEVSSCVELAEGEGYRIVADLADMPENIADKLARLALLTQRHQRVRQTVRPARMGEA
jgi:hypothetical protein